jgi:single-strand DNA-binding protein
MVSFNRVIVAGNLTRDPELRFTTGGIPVCDFGIAVNRVRSKNEEVDFFDVSAGASSARQSPTTRRRATPSSSRGASSTAPGRPRTALKGAR